MFLNALRLKKNKWDKAVVTYLLSTIKPVSAYYKTQEVCNKVFHVFYVFDSIPNHYKPQTICDIFVSEDSFLIVYCPDKYKTRRMYRNLVLIGLLKLK